MHGKRIRVGDAKLSKKEKGYRNGFVMPGNRFFKRKANRAARRNLDLSDGGSYKKCWGYWEWC